MVRASRAVLDELLRLASQIESWALDPAAWETVAAVIQEIGSALETQDDGRVFDLIDNLRFFGPSRLGSLSETDLRAEGSPGRREALDHLNMLIGRPVSAKETKPGGSPENASS